MGEREPIMARAYRATAEGGNTLQTCTIIDNKKYLRICYTRIRTYV